MQSASSQPSAVNLTWHTISMIHARENWLRFSRTSTKKLVSTILASHLQSGVKVSGTSLNGPVLNRNGVSELNLVTTRPLEDGHRTSIHLKQANSIMAEVLSSCHGTTTTEHFQRCLSRVLTTVECTSLRTQTRSIKMLSLCSRQLFGST